MLQYRLKEHSPQSRVRNIGVKRSKLSDGGRVLLMNPTEPHVVLGMGSNLGGSVSGEGQLDLQSWVAKPECPGSTRES